ncbi:hypothetical protein [Rubinisphaera sp.]|uniref:hypothetical protein n=1 Tax=Rubinisphaera sp. TaxID=2024857 RepID=UPI000C0D4DA4|nr:hypothetical protein [Rubinisphaera sp.]MBV10576.1 hypothetical protein [Rubinisphaera sp.]|tara:strand:- start:6626 stop:7894 length:1269 start_codon:yes stop_codon:yes gene_type:complete
MKKFAFWAFQIVVLAGFGIAYGVASPNIKNEIADDLSPSKRTPIIDIPREVPLRVESLYDRPDMVSDEDLAAVLWQVRPKFERKELRPNLVEHAIRAWSVHAEFRDPDVLSGKQMEDFLLDHGTFILSWGESASPLLQDRPTGVGVNWGEYRSNSVHHDHMLACITEAGARLDSPVLLPSQRQLTLENVIHEALRDFQLDERETEWSAMAFGLWLPPTKTWRAINGREMSFDLLAQRLMRGYLEKGVCSGTHRVYSLMLLWRLDQEFDILSEDVQNEVYAHLELVRDLITESQFEDGHWPPNWNEGSTAVENPREREIRSEIIATGHHLEWLSIAPIELHPPREQIDKAAQWIIQTTKQQTPELILQRYTFLSHVGNALALWRGTTPAAFWKQWQKDNPEYTFTPIPGGDAQIDSKSEDTTH